MRKFTVVMTDTYRTWEEQNIYALNATEAVEAMDRKYKDDPEVYVEDVMEHGKSVWLEYQFELSFNW